VRYPHVELAADPHDRVGERRADEAWLDAAWADPDTRVLVVAGTRVRPVDEAVQWVSPAEGYLETQSYNVVTRTSGNIQNADRESYITIRMWADSIGGGLTKVTAEATVLRSSDGSVVGRDREAPVQPGHPGDVIVHRILQGLKGRFGR